MSLPAHATADNGIATGVVTAGVTTPTTVKTLSGYLSRVLVTSANGAAAINIYDNASAASGTIVGIVPASAAAGSVYTFGMPVTNGITVGGAATNGALTISFI